MLDGPFGRSGGRVGAESRECGVHVGRDGWLFWLGAAGQVPRLYRDSIGSLWWLLRWRWLLAGRRRRCRALGAEFRQVFAPDKLTIYADRLARPLVRPRRGFAWRMRGASDVVDLIEPLERARAAGETYLRTDTHWTPHGYRTAYRAVCDALGAAPQPHVLAGQAGEPVEVVLDLGGKCDPVRPERLTPEDFPRTAILHEANALMRHRERLHPKGFPPGFLVGSRSVWTNASPHVDPRRIVVFGDSYAFHHGGLGAMLAETFAETHLLWSAGFDWGYLARVRPDLVLHETAERFARMVPVDGVDVDAVGDARVRGARAALGPPAANA